MSLNENHPELQEGEAFLTNVSENERFRLWSNLPYEHKRVGEIAYDTDGNPMKNMHPVFVSRAELEKITRKK